MRMGEEALDHRVLRFIPVPWGHGGPDPAPAMGPVMLRDAGLAQVPARHGLGADWQTLVAVAEAAGPDSWESLAELLQRLAARVAEAAGTGIPLEQADLPPGMMSLPVVVGGDHSIAAGTWRGVARALAERGLPPPGLLWIDAHLDSHTPWDSASGNPHGMPLAALLGEGHQAMVGAEEPYSPDYLGPVLAPERVVVLGARSWEEEELERLQRLGVRVITAQEVASRGLAPCLGEALARVRGQGTAQPGFFGISLDMDAFDPADAPGVTCPAADGLRASELLPALVGLARDPDCVALELVEYAPDRDPGDATERLACQALDALLTEGGG